MVILLALTVTVVPGGASIVGLYSAAFESTLMNVRVTV